MSTRRVGSHTVETSSEDKVYFPDDDLTKGDVLDYYEWVADRMLPFVKDRAVTMHRFPDGIGADGFIQQKAGEHFPDWVGRKTLSKVTGGEVEHVVCRNTASIVYLANQGVITPHVWLSRIDRINQPDRLIFDLDPENGDFSPVRRAALAIRGVAESYDLIPFAMTTGSSGLHVTIPIRRGPDFEIVRGFAREVAAQLAAQYPDELTIEQRKDKRGGRVYLDIGRNAYGQTAVAPYALRARQGGPVATPLDWHEIQSSKLHARRYTIKNIRRRLAQKEDPWEAFHHSAARLPSKSA